MIANLDDGVAAVFRLSIRATEDNRDCADDGNSPSRVAEAAGADTRAVVTTHAEADDAKLDDAALPIWLL